MPLKVMNVLLQRQEFVERCLEGALTISALCLEYEISRTTGYKYLRRFIKQGEEGLKDMPRVPKTIRNKVGEDIKELILDFKRTHLYLGAQKILGILKNRCPAMKFPARSTVDIMFKKEGMLKKRKPHGKAKPTKIRTEPTGPNVVWAADFKGEFRTKDGRLCYPFTFMDTYNRYLFSCLACSSISGEAVRKEMERVFKIHGLPQVILTDNGAPFASTGIEGYSKLSVWLNKLGIKTERIDSGEPQQNGRLERLHKTLKEYLEYNTLENVYEQQAAFDYFIEEYDNERPHESLENKPPATLYVKSGIKFPNEIKEVRYPGGWMVRKVNDKGKIQINKNLIRISKALKGEPVGITEIAPERLAAYYGDKPLVVIDGKKYKRLPRKVEDEIIRLLWKEPEGVKANV